MRIGIRELRADLTAAVRRAAGGDPLVVTIGGEPVARLVPLAEGGSAMTLDDLIAVRAVLPPRRRDRPPAPKPLDVPVDARTDRALREIR